MKRKALLSKQVITIHATAHGTAYFLKGVAPSSLDDLLVKVIETAWAVVRESEAEWRVATGRLPI